MLTDKQLDELERLAAQATPRPWLVARGHDAEVQVWCERDSLKFVAGTGYEKVESSGHDAAFIAAVANALPELLAMARCALPRSLDPIFDELLSVRKQLIAEGRSPWQLGLSRADLERFNLAPWSGTWFGMWCADA